MIKLTAQQEGMAFATFVVDTIREAGGDAEANEVVGTILEKAFEQEGATVFHAMLALATVTAAYPKDSLWDRVSADKNGDTNVADLMKEAK